jgi:hypothetical protein
MFEVSPSPHFADIRRDAATEPGRLIANWFGNERMSAGGSQGRTPETPGGIPALQ